MSRGTPPHRHTFPFDSFSSTKASDDSPGLAPPDPQPAENSPSLVSQLQQRHGLTKKKVYGAKPTRQPFFRDEPVREKYRRVPAPLSMPLSAPVVSPLSAIAPPSGRAVSRSRADRILRVGQGSPTAELHPRLHNGWPRRGSRMSSPEADGMSSPGSTSTFNEVSPITSYFSSNLSSPVSPTPVDESYIMSSSIPQVGVGPLGPMDTTVSAEPWQHTYMPVIPPLSQPGYRAFSSQPSTPDTRPQANDGYFGAMHHQVTAVQPGYAPMPSLHNMPVDDFQLNARSGLSNGGSRPVSRATRAQSSAQDEEPFVFGEEYVAVTAALFNREVLPAYPNFPFSQPARGSGNMPSPPIHAHAFHLGSSQESLPPSPSYHPGDVYGSRAQHGGAQHRAPAEPSALAESPLAYSSSFSPGSSSSLTGWAG